MDSSAREPDGVSSQVRGVDGGTDPLEDSHSVASGRPAAFARGAPGVPRKFIAAALALVVVLGVGGVLVERVLTAAGLNPDGGASSPASSGSQPSAAYPPPLSGGPAPDGSVPGVPVISKVLGAAAPSLLGLTDLNAAGAPPVLLKAPNGATVDLAALEGRVVVLSFFDSACDDICPVLGTEIAAADASLGAASSRVEFVTVNTDPLSPSASARPLAVFGNAKAPSNWVFASGTVAALDSVWADYHISVDVTGVARKITHTDVLYFVDPRGLLRYRATPFANEDLAGRWSLPGTVEAAWGGAMAAAARDLLR